MSGMGLTGLGGAGIGGSGVGDWMIDTFIYTGILIALVLLLRRPVARYFGARIAYALWALPLLRFVMPPIVLPASMAPVEPVAQAAAGPAANEPLLVMFFEPGESAAASASTIAAPTSGIAAIDLLLSLWVAGALVFLGLRVRDYVHMRRTLLAEARPMGEAGDVRLVETPAVSAPVAFGIRDKVVALPVDFMALLDVRARDMAIAHELEHHRGHDLLANLAAQPLLALHWFNPLAWWGWRAMRRDQEAACDARVVAGCARSERAAYAEVIAGFAAGEHLALAAPMACPVLGEKSIIHRLRSLTMTEHSNTRRRIGIAAITSTALALPLTASISYAQDEGGEAEDAFATEMVLETEDTVEVEGDTHLEWTSEDENGEESHYVITRHGGQDASEEGEEHRYVFIRRMSRGEGDEGDTQVRRMTPEERARILADHEHRMSELRLRHEGLGAEHMREVELALAEARRAGHDARNAYVVDGDGVHVECEGDDPVVERELEDGRRMVVVCRAAIHADAVEGLREAIEEIRSDADIPPRVREDIIREMQRSIERMERRHQGAALRMERKLQRQGTEHMSAVLRAPRAPRAPLAPHVEQPPQSERISVAFRWSDADAPNVRVTPLLNPVSGAPFRTQRDEDCEENQTRA